MDIQEEFHKLDLRKSFAVGIGLLVFYYFMMFDSGSGLEARIARAKASQQKNQAALRQVEKAIADKKKFDQEIKTITQNMKDFARYFDPSGMSSNVMQSEISKLAEQHSLAVNEMKPVEKTPEFPKYKEIAVEFKIEGPFHDVMEFVSSLTQRERALDFSQMKFKVTVAGDYPQVELQTILVVYASDGLIEGDNG